MKYFLILHFIFFAFNSIIAQSVDRIEAIIGDEVVLKSDIENQYLQYLNQGNIKSMSVKCELIEDILFQKLLVNQAKLDSIQVSSEEVDDQVTQRINYFIDQLGSINEIEKYFNKTKSEIEAELNDMIRDQILSQKMQNKITSDISITPSEVREIFSKQMLNDIPEIPTKVEVSQLVIKPIISEKQKNELKSKLNSFRDRVYNGEDFAMLATLYSDDPGSSSRGGELGFVDRGSLVPEFERAAFRLKEGEISEVIKSIYGYHIIQLISRRGEQINVRHILLKPKTSFNSLAEAKSRINKIKGEIDSGDISFEDAIEKYSEDINKNNGGKLINQQDMSTLHILDDLNSSFKYKISNLKVNELSEPLQLKDNENQDVYKIIRVNKLIKSHKANLSDDFSLIKQFAINFKKQNELMQWIQNTVSDTYIVFVHDLSDCNFKNKWINER